MNTPAPNPARFDGHWLTPRQMADLLPISVNHLGVLARNGVLPARCWSQAGFGRPRRYDAGAVLRWRQDRTDRRRRP